MPNFDPNPAEPPTLPVSPPLVPRGRYLLPREKFRLIRSAAHALWLLDNADKKEGANAFQHKRIQRARFGRWFRRYPIVPMYGDMFANLQHILQRCPNWAAVNADDFFATSKREVAQVADGYALGARVPRLRAQVLAFTAEFTALVRTIDAAGGGAGLRLPREEHTHLSLALSRQTLRGLRLMSELNSLLLEAVAHKCGNPAGDATLAARFRGGESDAEPCDYERALRYARQVTITPSARPIAIASSTFSRLISPRRRSRHSGALS